MSIYIFIGLALLGAAIHVITKLATLENKGIKVSIVAYFSDHKYSTILSVAVAVACVFIFNSMNQLNEVSAIAAGYMGDSILKNAMTKFRNGKK